jgi:hypothetical protein
MLPLPHLKTSRLYIFRASTSEKKNEHPRAHIDGAPFFYSEQVFGRFHKHGN